MVESRNDELQEQLLGSGPVLHREGSLPHLTGKEGKMRVRPGAHGDYGQGRIHLFIDLLIFWSFFFFL